MPKITDHSALRFKQPRAIEVTGSYKDDLWPSVNGRSTVGRKTYQDTLEDAIQWFKDTYGHLKGLEIEKVEFRQEPKTFSENGQMAWEIIDNWIGNPYEGQSLALYDVVDSVRLMVGSHQIASGSTRITIIPDDGDYVYKIPYNRRGYESTVSEANWDPENEGGAKLAKAEVLDEIVLDNGSVLPVLKMEKIVKHFVWKDWKTGQEFPLPAWYTDNKRGFDGFQGGYTASGELVLYDP